MKTRIPSTIVTAIFVQINSFFMFFFLLPMDLHQLLEGSAESMPDTDGMGMIAMVPLLLVGAVIVFFLFWMLAIAITHAILLIFTVKNRKSPLKPVRIINYILTAANIILIAAPIIKILLFYLT
ncbi:MAG: hypothetical protein J6L83_05710 [Clostridia bacterium]|nr:hypothetical protein [Clostridia bacterium]